MKFYALSFALVLFTFLAPVYSEGHSEEAPAKKLCLAHYVAWGFNHALLFDQWEQNPAALDPLTDRPLLGRNIQWDSGVWEGTRKQIDCARLYGIDGFVVDVVNISSVCAIMKRFFSAAEGTDFKIVLCVDTYVGTPAEGLIGALGDFARKYKKHPNSWIHDGKLVVFAYNLGVSASDWAQVETALNADQETSIFMLPRLIGEGKRGEKPEVLAEWLAGCDGIYDFGCNGFFPEEMAARLACARDALKKNRPEGLLVAGVAPGYIGLGTGFYRPFLNTQTLRDNWAAAIEAGADHVCLTTWNDYAEHTAFEPTVHSRTALLRLNQEFIRIWRGETPPKRPAEVIFSAQEEVLDGSDWTLEVLNFSYTTEPETVLVRLLNENGEVLKTFDPIPLPREKMGVTTLRVPEEEMKDWRVVNVQAAKVLNSSAEEPVFRNLPPLVRRNGRLATPRTTHTVWSEISRVPIRLRIERNKKDGEKAVVSLETWTAAGRLELVRNGWPVWEEEFSHLKSPVFRREIPLPEAQSPFDVYYVRYTNSADCPGWSNAASRIAPETENFSVTKKVLRTGAAFDEEWPIWSRRISRLDAPVWEEREIPAWAAFSLDFQLDGAVSQDGALYSRAGWRLPLVVTGGKWVQDETLGRPVLELDGKTLCRFQTRSFPAETFCLTLELKPARTDREMLLFQDGAGVSLTMDETGRVVYRLNRQSICSAEPLPKEKWSKLEARFDGERLTLLVNGEISAESPLSGAPRRFLINSRPRLGAGEGMSQGFEGRMSQFRLE